MGNELKPASVVIFGAGGDLTWRKLIPALYNLFVDGWLPSKFAVVGVDKKEMSDDEFRARLRDGVDEFSRRGQVEADTWQRFAVSLTYLRADFDDPAAFQALAKRLHDRDAEWGKDACRIYYLAIPP
ncbi:MAG TPA: glucose-6-phosphate dehydrogenase, partial [Anaerolineae bacterium]